MYVIMVYDVEAKRVYKVLKIARKYLTHIQNSVLEGGISKTNFRELKKEIKMVIDKTHDTVLFYILFNKDLIKKDRLGIAIDEPIEIL